MLTFFFTSVLKSSIFIGGSPKRRLTLESINTKKSLLIHIFIRRSFSSHSDTHEYLWINLRWQIKHSKNSEHNEIYPILLEIYQVLYVFILNNISKEFFIHGAFHLIRLGILANVFSMILNGYRFHKSSYNKFF